MVCYGIFRIGQSCIEYTEHVAIILLTDHQKNSFPERNFQCPQQPLLNQLYIIAIYAVKEPCCCLSGSVPRIFSHFQNPGDMGIPFSYRLSDLGWGQGYRGCLYHCDSGILANEKTLGTRLGSSLHGSSTLFDLRNNVLKSRPFKSALQPFFEQTTTLRVKNQNSLQTKNKSSPSCVICCFISEYMQALVCYTAVFSVVTQRSEERCVTTLKTAVQQTNVGPKCLVKRPNDEYVLYRDSTFSGHMIYRQQNNYGSFLCKSHDKRLRTRPATNPLKHDLHIDVLPPNQIMKQREAQGTLLKCLGLRALS